jgi:hypothetical protein
MSLIRFYTAALVLVSLMVLTPFFALAAGPQCSALFAAADFKPATPAASQSDDAVASADFDGSDQQNSVGVVARLTRLMKASKGRTAPPRPLTDISQDEFFEIAKITKRLSSAYPSDKYIFVAIGRSPTPIMAMLAAFGHKDLYMVPFSNTRNHPDISWIENYNFRTSTDGALRPRIEAQLFEHFARFLPTKEVVGERKLLLLDFVQSGASLASADAYILKYFEKNNIKLVTEKLILSDVDSSHKQVDAIARLPQFDMFHSPFLMSLRRSAYEPYSEFGRYNVQKDHSPDLSRNPLYDLLVAEFTRRLKE